MTRSAPTVSVVTIVRNGVGLLERSMDSLAAQDFGDFECIVVNDGSTDGTAELIDGRAAADPRIRAVHLAENIGRSAARNRGLDEARGRYLLYLDADDAMPPWALGKLVELGETHGSEIVMGATEAHDQYTWETERWYYTQDIVDARRINITMEDHLPLVYLHQVLGTLFRRDFVLANDIRFPEAHPAAEDLAFMFQANLRSRRITMDPGFVAYHYSHGNFIATASEAKLISARENILGTLELARREGSPAVQDALVIKAAEYGADLQRPQRVYPARGEAYWEFVRSLVPLAAGVRPGLQERMPDETYQTALLYQAGRWDALKILSEWNEWVRLREAELEAQRWRLEIRQAQQNEEWDALQRSLSLRLARPLAGLLGQDARRDGPRPAPEPLVSVIVPVYNASKHLADCLDSVLGQSHHSLELIAVDDGSEDGSLELLRGRAAEDGRLRILSHPENQGIASARNTGLEQARGDYVFFIDADDRLADPGSLEGLVTVARDTDADQVIGGMDYWNPDTGGRWRGWHHAYLEREVRGQPFTRIPELRNNVVVSNKLLRKSFLDRHGIRFDASLRQHEDDPFSCRAHVLASRISVLTETTYLYRQHPDSHTAGVSRNNALSRSASCRVLFEFLAGDHPAAAEMRALYLPVYLPRLFVKAWEWEVAEGRGADPGPLIESWREAIAPLPEHPEEVSQPILDVLAPLRAGNDAAAWRQARMATNYRYPLGEVAEPPPHDHVRKKRARLERRETAVRTLRAEVIDLSRRINDLRDSREWRMTRPLRRLAARLGSGRN